ncbi:MAG: YesL family protein, partial [Clostridiaceae bacterium]|nr:YesL family protein [Clostridiaceae bacterium]
MRYDGPFMRLWEQVLGYIYLTLVWLVFCIPLVTIGAATSAFYGTARRYLIAREG